MAEVFVSFTPKVSQYKDYTLDSYVENVFTSLYSLLNTPKGSHPYDPEFGVGLKRYILEPDNGTLATRIEEDIKGAIRNYLPEIYSLSAVSVSRELHPTGIGYKYTAHIVIQNTVISFGMDKEGHMILSRIQEIPLKKE